MSARVYFMKRVEDCKMCLKCLRKMNSEDRQVYSVCILQFSCFTKFNRFQSKHKQTKCEHSIVIFDQVPRIFVRAAPKSLSEPPQNLRPRLKEFKTEFLANIFMFRQTNLAFYRKDDALILCEQPINLFVIYFSLKTRMVKLKKKKNRGLFFLIFFFLNFSSI